MQASRFLPAVLLLFLSSAAIAAPASDESIRQLFAVTQVQKILDGTKAQLRALMDKTTQQALQGTIPTASQQRAIDRMKARMLTVIQGELAWEKLEPMYLRLYSETFTDEEVEGMLAFYATPAGKAVINKMPQLMQQTMVEMQKRMTDVLPRMQKIQQEFLSEVQPGAGE